MAEENYVPFDDLSPRVRELIAKNDIGMMSDEERTEHYANVCKMLGLNPLTSPLGYFNFDGRVQLYAKREATEQLRALHGISCEILSRDWITPPNSEHSSIYVVSVRASRGSRIDEASGAVSMVIKRKNRATQKIEKYALADEEVANAMLRCECVPLESQILTRRGWKYYNDVLVGEYVLAFNCESGNCEWTPLEGVSVYRDARLATITSDDIDGFSLSCTRDHKWVFTDGKKHLLAELADVGDRHDLSLVLSAPAIDSSDSILSPAEAAVLGWAVVSGEISKKGITLAWRGSRFVDHTPLDNFLRAAVGSDVDPQPGESGVLNFRIPARSAEAILEGCQYENISDIPMMISALNSRARTAMLNAMKMANENLEDFRNFPKPVVDSFDILTAMEGEATATKKGGANVIDFTSRKQISSGDSRHMLGQALIPVSTLRMSMSKQTSVWCPTTKFGTWVMRQNGQVSITGNTKAKRRATLSICGLSFMDETEIEDVATPDGDRIEVVSAPTPAKSKRLSTVTQIFDDTEKAGAKQEEQVHTPSQEVKSEEVPVEIKLDKKTEPTLGKADAMQIWSKARNVYGDKADAKMRELLTKFDVKKTTDLAVSKLEEFMASMD